ADGPIVAPHGQQPTIGRERDRMDRLLVLVLFLQPLACRDIPQTDGAADGSGERLAVWRKGRRHAGRRADQSLLPEDLLRRDIPEDQRPVLTDRGDTPAVGRAGHSIDRPAVPLQSSKLLPGSDVPQAHVGSRRRHGPAVRADREAPHLAERLVGTTDLTELLAGRRVPEAEHTVSAAG